MHNFAKICYFSIMQYEKNSSWVKITICARLFIAFAKMCILLFLLIFWFSVVGLFFSSFCFFTSLALHLLGLFASFAVEYAAFVLLEQEKNRKQFIFLFSWYTVQNNTNETNQQSSKITTTTITI